MGYTTDFEGAFAVTPPLRPEHAAYLRAFANTRRMTRDERATLALPDPLRLAVGLTIGKGGGYYVGAAGFKGQDHTPEVTNYNHEPDGQHSLGCDWEPNEAGTAIEWNGMEKFYNYTAWLQYVLDHFLTPWGYALSGDVRWQGEDPLDRGTLTVVDGRAVEAVAR